MGRFRKEALGVLFLFPVYFVIFVAILLKVMFDAGGLSPIERDLLLILARQFLRFRLQYQASPPSRSIIQPRTPSIFPHRFSVFKRWESSQLSSSFLDGVFRLSKRWPIFFFAFFFF